MGNITGEATRGYVTNQVSLRQRIQGSANRTNSQLQYLTNRNAYVSLASSVVVEDDKKGQGFSGSDLARKFVLSNGTTEFKRTEAEKTHNKYEKIGRSGVINSNDPDNLKNNNNAYGVGGLDFGLAPMMGITSVDIKSENRGSLRTAVIEIIANNKDQFEIIESLYIKLGYNMLLEWGWTDWYDNSGAYLNTSNFNPSLIPYFLERNIGYDSFLRLIENNRKICSGNYDAFLGRVVNFSWKFSKAGQYEITLTLRSIGDVLESFKANTLLPSDQKIISEKEEQLKIDIEEKQTESQDLRLDSYVARGYYEQAQSYQDNLRTSYYVDPVYIQKDDGTYQQEFPSDPATNALETLNEVELAAAEAQAALAALEAQLDELQNTKSTLQKELVRIKKRLGEKTEKTYSIHGTGYVHSSGKKADHHFALKKTFDLQPLRQDDQGNDIQDTSTINYVSLGYILYYIQKYIIPYDPKFKSRIINFDLDVDSNLILLPPYLYPGLPSQCLFNIQLGDNYTASSKMSTFENKKGKNEYAKIFEIFFSFDLINNLLNNNDLSLVDFFQSLMDVYCKSTGGFNIISVTVDPDTNYLRFIDEKSAASEDLLTKAQTSKFNSYGYAHGENEQESNFIRDLNFNTTITPRLSMMITAGSTKDGYYPGYDATGLSTINQGYVDYMKESLNNYAPKEADLRKTTDKRIGEQYSKSVETVRKFFNKYVDGILDRQLEPELPNILNNIQQADTFYSTTSTKQTSPNAQSPTGFIPFDATLTLDGLAGMKIYNRIEFSQEFLPSNYPDTLNFLVRGINHSIEGNDWTTNITTFAVPKNVFVNSESTIKDAGTKKGKGKGGGTPDLSDKTITTEFPLNPNSHGKGGYTKTQLMFHYSVTWQRSDKGQNVIDVLNKRGLTYHYVIDGAGHVEQIVEDDVLAWHGGDQDVPRLSANAKSIGINFQNMGYARKATSTEAGITQNFKKENQFTGNVKLVDHEGNPSPYRGHEFAQEITNEQYNSAKELIEKLIKKHSGIPAFVWEGKKTFDKLFPPPNSEGEKQTSYSKSVPGLYTHNSNQTGKSDCLPTPKIVKLFKELGTVKELTQREKDSRSYTNFKSLVEDIQKIFKLKDEFGSAQFINGTYYADPLFEPYKGNVSDDEEGASIAFGKWFRSPDQKKRLALIESPDREHFRKQVNLLIAEMQESFSSNVTFKSSVGGSSSFIVNPDF